MTMDDRAKASLRLLALLSAVFSGLVSTETARADAISLKEFLLNNVAANAPISAGGLVETWASKEKTIQFPKVVIKAGNPMAQSPVQPVERSYASGVTQTAQSKVNNGLPISATGTNVDKADSCLMLPIVPLLSRATRVNLGCRLFRSIINPTRRMPPSMSKRGKTRGRG
jgi:hypothetical protein